jgi:hypothetical protein
MWRGNGAGCGAAQDGDVRWRGGVGVGVWWHDTVKPRRCVARSGDFFFTREAGEAEFLRADEVECEAASGRPHLSVSVLDRNPLKLYFA